MGAYDVHMPNKEIETVVRALIRQGFDVEKTRKNHYKIRKAGRVVAMLPATPGGGSNALKHILRKQLPALEAEGYVHTGVRW